MLRFFARQGGRASPERAEHRLIAEAGSVAGGIQKNFGLDAFRATAILLVMAAHLAVWGIEEMQPSADWLHRLGWLSQITGVVGVELFFVLSGYLVGKIALTRNGSLMHFYMRRWLRTFPAYAVMLVILLLTKGVPDDFWAFVLFLQPPLQDFFSVSWSLCVEEWFYLLLPLFLFIPRRYFIHATIAVLIALLTLRISSGLEYETLRRTTFLRLDVLLIGVLLAWVKLEKQDLYNYLQKPITLLLCSAFILCVVFISGVMRMSGVYLPMLETNYAIAALFTIMPLSFALLLPHAEKLPPLLQAPITAISAGAYSLYLVHEEIFRAVRQTIWFDNIYGFVIALIASALAAAILYRCIEKPFMDLRAKHFS